MNWQKRYLRAIKKGIQLISDETIRNTAKSIYKKYPFLEEVRFKNFTADLLFINPIKKQIHGMEIKSDRDNVDKLKHQLRGYLQYCNKVFVVTTLGQYKDVLRVVNTSEFYNVGVMIYVKSDEGARFDIIKEAYNNKVFGVGSSWITKKHQLYQWLYLLEMIWGK